MAKTNGFALSSFSTLLQGTATKACMFNYCIQLSNAEKHQEDSNSLRADFYAFGIFLTGTSDGAKRALNSPEICQSADRGLFYLNYHLIFS